MGERKYCQKKDYNIIYTEASQLLKEFSKLETKKLQNSLLDKFFLNYDSTAEINNRLDSVKRTVSLRRRFKLILLLWRMLKVPFLVSGTLKILSVISQYILFFFLDSFTDTLKGYNIDSQDKSDIKKKSAFYLSLMVICLLINGVCNNRFTRYRERAENHMKTILQVMLYDKLLKVKSSETKEGESSDEKKEEDEEEKLNLNNLITSDIESASGCIWGFHELWTAVISIIICFIMIGNKLKSALYFGIIIMIILNIINLLVTKKLLSCFEKMSSFKDKRIALTTDVVHGIKSIKYLSWENIFMKRINDIRKDEFKYFTFNKALDAILGVLWNFLPTIMLFATLAWYVEEGNDIYDSNVFTIIGLMNVLNWPIVIIPWTIGHMSESKIALERISRYLDREDIDPSKVFRGDEKSSIAIEIQGLQFTWPLDKSSGPAPKKKEETKEITASLLENEAKGLGLERNFQLLVEDLVLERGELYFLLGKVGSGKTALLKSIMNELDLTPMAEGLNNSVYSQESNFNITNNNISVDEKKMTFVNPSKKVIVNGQIGYVSQNNWLQDTTIKNNILLGSDLDPDWYQNCLNVCELLPDLEIFPRGDEYIVGTNGANLSGGQRQRIALCRAIYQNADIYLFDDAFSSLDVHVSERIFNKLITKLLKSMGKTILFATSTHSFIEPSSNLILINDYHMVITNPDEVKRQMQKLFKKEEEEEKEPDEYLNDMNTPHLGCKQSSKGEDVEVNNEEEEALKKVKIHEISHDNEEEREEGALSLKTVQSYLKALGMFLAITYLVTVFTMQAIKSVSDFWLKSRITPGDTSFSLFDSITSNFTLMFAYLTITVLVLLLLNNTCYLFSAIITAKKIFEKLMKSIMFSKMVFFDKNEIGRIVNRISKDTFIIDEQITFFMAMFLDKFVMVAAYPIVVAIQFPWMLIGFALGITVMYIFQKQYREMNREIKRLTAVNNSKVINHVTETIMGVTSVRAFKKEKHFLNVFLNHLNEASKSLYVNQLLFYWIDIRLVINSFLLFMSLSLVILIFVLCEKSISFSDCAMALAFLYLFNDQINNAFVYFAELELNLISVERVRQYFDNPLEDINEIPKQVLSNPDSEADKGFSVVFDRVFLSYNNDKSNENEPVNFALKNVSFALKKGEKVAFCGRTGSGKTSILNVLFRMYDIHSGDIRLEGGKSIRNLSLLDLRSQIAIIPQFGFLFRATLRENLDPEGNCKDDFLKSIVLKSGFNVKGKAQAFEKQDTVNNEETDLNFSVENSGSNLSNGEKQIINFLRILIRNNDIICLDEATSNMDPKTDKELHNALFKLTENKTLIVITHRLEHIHHYDRVFVMEKGEIVEQGHVNELRQNKDSFFRKIIEKKSD